jgi:hypothetical protein
VQNAGYASGPGGAAEHKELIKSAKKLQQEILQADKPVADQDVEFLER